MKDSDMSHQVYIGCIELTDILIHLRIGDIVACLLFKKYC